MGLDFDQLQAAGQTDATTGYSDLIDHWYHPPISQSVSHRLSTMAPPSSRTEVLTHLKTQVKNGKPIVGAGAGTGLSAKFIEAGGADLIIIYNSGRFRMAGRGSLAGLMPYGDANAVVVDMAREVLPILNETGVLAGVCGTDPFRIMPKFLEQLKGIGFCGVQNFPTVGLIDGTFRINLEETGMGYDKEVDMIAEAHKLDLLTTPYVFNVDEAERMTKAGADVLGKGYNSLAPSVALTNVNQFAIWD